ncbi:glycosyltransferase family protein [Sphingomonas melonis]
MLAGLLFAMHDADDRPNMLTATLPFGGVTLIEYQARLLIAAGASQIIIVVARLTPELLGAINRIGKRGIAVDTVRTAAEAAETLHPLARVLMLADGLTTTGDTLAVLAREGGDALLVVPEDQVGPGYERLGGGMVWAGVARL